MYEIHIGNDPKTKERRFTNRRPEKRAVWKAPLLEASRDAVVPEYNR
jgi:hypothetical protein